MMLSAGAGRKDKEKKNTSRVVEVVPGVGLGRLGVVGGVVGRLHLGDRVDGDGVARVRGLGLVGGGLVAQGCGRSVVGHSHTDQGLNSQRTPFAKA